MPRSRRKIAPVWGFFCEGVEVFRLQNNDATRQVITGRRNHVVGGHFSRKMGCHLIHEGGFEERLVRAADCLLRVKRIWAQPETIRMNLFADYPNEIYTPDFLVEEVGAFVRYCVKDAGFVRYEVKEWEDLRPPRPADWDEDGKAKWEDAKLLRARLRRVRSAYRKAGVPWRVVTERGLAKRWGKPNIIDEIIANDRWDIDPEDLNRLVSALIDAGGSLPMSTCEAILAETIFPRGVVLSRIPENIVSIDTFSPIDGDTIVRKGYV
ncbi:hypothetical protein ACFPFP_02335 [Bradyrhizobium sp. GCM10023182]|uniref:TnsA endonuclease N-terminal domain-containing protein n=1 Tax=Bradyrhizobium zhengyangense TaxID=2911009 RepID=A0ABS9LFI7_9BRAD|nr:hypothetical protein [Bradyrhizobium zhengyangense]MCG2665767.1 hypothetical protein [Bradyrhizobium zhengyangense]